MTSELERECEKWPQVTMTTRYGEATEHRPDSPNNWRVTLTFEGRQMSTDFYGGSAVTDISVADVLYSLLLDAEAGSQTFEDFCGDLGYDTDSRSAYATWQACKKVRTKLRRFLDTSYGRFANKEH